MVIFCLGIIFESYLKMKENIISTGLIFGWIGVGLWTKDRRNPTKQTNPKPNHIFLLRLRA
jgi:hypothetical protein